MTELAIRVNFEDESVIRINTDEKEPLVDSEIITQGKICLLLSHASKNNVSGMIELFEMGVSPDDADYDKRTALHLACSDGSLDAARLLIERGADLNLADRFGNTCLDDALESGDKDIVALLKERGANFGNKSKLQTDLITAASSSDKPKVQKLLDGGVNVNSCDYDNRTALHLAVATNNVEMASLLMEYGADPHFADRTGLTPWADVVRNKVRSGFDPMTGVFEKFMDIQHHPLRCGSFLQIFVALQIAFIILFFTVVEYNGFANKIEYNTSDGTVIDKGVNIIKGTYAFYQDIHVMIFIGFGFLMTFLRKNAFSAVGGTFMISVFCIQWYILSAGLIEQGIVYGASHSLHKIGVSLKTLVLGDFCAGAVLISYGAVLGKINPLQLMVMATIETVLYVINEAIATKMDVHDLGGSMIIHMFGAYFGMGVSIMMQAGKTAPSDENNKSIYHSDMFAMIGTVFLWLYWPSFNGGLSIDDFQQHRAVINTLLSLCGSCFAAFLASYYFRKENKFAMVDIQNATLAGGVAMGACCDLMIAPGAALLIGAIAGVISVLGYVYIQPRLQKSIGYLDTCGINNLHGMPSILGAIASVIAAASINADKYTSVVSQGVVDSTQLSAIFATVAKGERTVSEQAQMHLAFIGITLGISFVGGCVVGGVIKQSVFDPIHFKSTFLDSEFWEAPQREVPYYFDERGEIDSHGNDGAVQNEGPSARGPHASDPMLESKVKAIEANVNDLKKRVGGRGSQQFKPINSPGPYSSQQSSSSANLELQLMLSKLINKVDEQANTHRVQMERMMTRLPTFASAAGDTQNGCHSPSSTGLKYVY